MGQRVGSPAADPAEIVRGLLRVALFCFPGGKDLLRGLQEGIAAPGGGSGRLPEMVSQADRIAQGIHFVFAFPDPRPGLLRPAGVIQVGPAVIGLPVERVGIRIQDNVAELPFQQSQDCLGNLPVFPGMGYIMVYLGGGIPEPHGGNISRHQEHRAVRPLQGGIPGAAKTGAVHLRQFVPSKGCQPVKNRLCRFLQPIHDAVLRFFFYLTRLLRAFPDDFRKLVSRSQKWSREGRK